MNYTYNKPKKKDNMPRINKETWEIVLQKEHLADFINKLKDNLDQKDITLENNSHSEEISAHDGGGGFQFRVIKKKPEENPRYSPAPPTPKPETQQPEMSIQPKPSLSDALEKTLDAVLDLIAPPPLPGNRLAPSMEDNANNLTRAKEQVYEIKLQPSAPTPQLTIKLRPPGMEGTPG